MQHATYPSLRGRVVFVSGGSSGIGAELVRAFARQGARVAFCGTKADGGQALTAELAAEGLRAVASGLAAHKSIDEGRVVAMSEVLPAGW